MTRCQDKVTHNGGPIDLVRRQNDPGQTEIRVKQLKCELVLGQNDLEPESYHPVSFIPSYLILIILKLILITTANTIDGVTSKVLDLEIFLILKFQIIFYGFIKLFNFNYFETDNHNNC